MYQRPHNPNKGFMIGSALLAFGVILIVVIFTLLAFRMSSRQGDQPQRYAERYAIHFSPTLVGSELTVYLNDSLLWDAAVLSDTLSVVVEKWEEENTLLVVDKATDGVTPLELSPEGETVTLLRQDGAITTLR